MNGALEATSWTGALANIVISEWYTSCALANSSNSVLWLAAVAGDMVMAPKAANLIGCLPLFLENTLMRLGTVWIISL